MKIFRKLFCAVVSLSLLASVYTSATEYMVNGTIDYSGLSTSDVEDYETGLSATAKTKTTFDINANEGALEIKTVGGADNATHYPTLPLGTERTITTANGPFSIRIKAKLHNHGSAVVRNFPMIGDGTTNLNFGLGWCAGQNISTGNLGLLMNANNRSDGMWTFKAEQKINNSEDANVSRTDNNVNITKRSDMYFLGLNEASESYYTYRWDVDPESKTFRFYYQKDGESAWTEAYADFNMINPYTPELGDRFEEKGVFPTGDLPEIISELKYQQRVVNGETTSLYIKSIDVRQEKLSLLNTGGALIDNKVKLRFNAPIDSTTIDAITVHKDGTKLLKDTDYTLSVKNSTIAGRSYVELALAEEAAEGTEILVNISEDINKNDNYARPSGTMSASFTSYTSATKYMLNGSIDYSGLSTSDVEDYETGLAATSKTKTTFDINANEGALEIKTVGGADNATHFPTLPLGTERTITTANGPFSIKIKAKLYNDNAANMANIRNFPMLSDGTANLNFGLGWCTGQNISTGNLGLLMNANNRSDGMWTYKAEQKINNSEDANLGRTDNNVNITKNSDRYFLGLNEASKNYYTYRWDVDPESKTFRFYYQKDGESAWTEPYADFNMINPYTPELGDRFEEKGVFPTGYLPETISELKYQQRAAEGETTTVYIKSITVQQEKLSLLNTGGVLIDNKVKLRFNAPIDSTTIDAITVYKDGTKLLKDTDYTLSVKNSTIAGRSYVELSLVEKASEGTEILVNISEDINKNDNYARPSGTMSASYTAERDINIYVSSNGNNSNIGSIKSPLKTIDKAIELYLERKTDEKSPVIYILDDIVIDKTIVLDEDCSNITFSAYGEKPVSISAGYTGGSITAACADDLDGKLPSEHIDKIIKWDISGYDGLTDDAVRKDYSYYNPELIDNGSPKTIARWPDSDWAYTGEVTADKRIKNENGSVTGEYIGFEFVTSAPLENMTLDNAKINGFWAWDYRLSKGDIIGRGERESSLDVKVNHITSSEYYFHSNRRYYLYNIPEEITSPGEYYIAYDTKMLYYYPEDINNYDLMLTGLKSGMFELKSGCDNVAFYGLTLENTRGTAISGDGCDGLKVDSCRIRNTGGRGIYICDTYNTEITKSYFGNIGDTAVEIIGGKVETFTPSNSSINNCEFENGGRIVGTYCPFVQLGAISGGEQVLGKYGTAIGIRVENNYFHNHMHSALIFEGNDFIIKNNIFDNVVNQTQDAGAIYSRVDPTYRGNEIKNNIFRNIRTFKKDEYYADLHAIYLDDLVPDAVVSENVFKNCSSAVNFGGGQSHTFKGNLVYDCFDGANYSPRQNVAEAAARGYLYTHLQQMKRAVANAGLDINTWYEKYPNYKNYTEKVEEYAAAVSNGETTVSDLYNENYDILHIIDEEYRDNVFVSLNAENGISSSGNAFCKIWQRSSVENQNVNAEHNYLSKDLNRASVNGTYVSLDSEITANGYNAPDVSNAGISENGIYSLDNGRTETEYITNSSDMFFSGYVFENFDGYSDGENVKNAREIKLSGTAQIGSDGNLEIPNGGNVEVKLPLPVNKSFAVEIKHSGKLTLDIGGNQVISYIPDGSVCVYRVDYESGTVSQLIKENDKFKRSDSLAVVLPNELDTINITAQETAKIDWIGVCSLKDFEMQEGFLDMNFEEVKDGTPAEMYSDRIITYGAFGSYSALVREEANGNNVLCLSELKYSESGRRSNVELIMPAVKTTNNIVNIEFKVKASSDSAAWLEGCVVPTGFNSDTPETAVEMTVLREDNDLNSLETVTNKQIAAADEWKSDYVKIKLEIDKSNSVVKVYKLNADGGWTEAAAVSCTSIPEYINKLRIKTNVPVDTSAEFCFDNVRVYTTAGLVPENEQGDETEISAGKTVYLRPDYIPGICGGIFIAGVYAENNTCLQNIVFADYEPYCEVPVTLPNDTEEYCIKRFIFTDIGSISPAIPARVFR